MTFEELKAEAEKQGYMLVKKKPYIKFAPCKCGFNYRNLIVDTNRRGVAWECQLCGTRVSGKNEVDAKVNWNKVMSNARD